MRLSTLWRLRSPGVLLGAVANSTTHPFAFAARATLVVSSLLALAACGGGGGTGGVGGGNPPPSTISVEGFVSGLAGSGLMLSNNGSDNLAVGTNGGFNFAKPLSNGDPYNVTITTQPNNPVQNCSILNGSGTGTVTTGSVTMVAVACLSAGRFLYVAGTGCPPPADCISAYSIDATSGAPTAVPGSPFPGAGDFQNSISVDPSSRFAYVAYGSLPPGPPAVVLAYTIDHTTGALTAVTGSPFTAPTSNVVAVDPSGNFLYVAGEGAPGPTGNPTASVSVFMIDTTTGALRLLADGPYATGPGPTAVTLDPSGKFVYVGCITGQGFYISAFTRDTTTGALTAVPGSPFLIHNDDPYLLVLSATVTVNPNGKFLYVSGQGFYPSGGGFALNPSGTFAYSFAEILAYAINPSSGALTALAGNPFSGGGSIVYAIDGTTGALTAVPGSLEANNLPPIAVDPSGNFAYAPDFNGGIDVFSINTGTGTLTAVAGSPFPFGGDGGSMVVSK